MVSKQDDKNITSEFHWVSHSFRLVQHLSKKPKKQLNKQQSNQNNDLILQTLIIPTNPSARAGYDTRSILKRFLTGLNSEFSFS